MKGMGIRTGITEEFNFHLNHVPAYGTTIAADHPGRIDTALRETREADAAKNPDRATEKAEALKTVMQEVGKAIYTQSPESGPQARPDVGEPSREARPTGAGPGGRVVDAEYREAGRAKD
jgi:molecular chaperone DnaK